MIKNSHQLIKFEHFVMASENNGFVRKEILKLRQQPGQLDADIKAVS